MGRLVTFNLAGMTFEYDEDKNQTNIEKHGLSFKSAARIFWDYNRIEFYDERHSTDEERYNTIGDVSAISLSENNVIIIGSFEHTKKIDQILFVVYTERYQIKSDGTEKDVIRLISARSATSFERGLYYGKF